MHTLHGLNRYLRSLRVARRTCTAILEVLTNAMKTRSTLEVLANARLRHNKHFSAQIVSDTRGSSAEVNYPILLPYIFRFYYV